MIRLSNFLRLNFIGILSFVFTINSPNRVGPAPSAGRAVVSSARHIAVVAIDIAGNIRAEGISTETLTTILQTHVCERLEMFKLPEIKYAGRIKFFNSVQALEYLR